MHAQTTLKRRLKSLEGYARSCLLDRLVRGSGAARSLAPPDWRARPYRVHYIRDDRIGDMIIATGLIRAIATSHPTITIDVLTQPASAQMLRGNPHVRVVIPFDKRRKRTYARALWRLARGRYDVAIDGMIVRPKVASTTSLLLLTTRAPYRIGIGSRVGGRYTLPVPPVAPALCEALGLWRPRTSCSPRTRASCTCRRPFGGRRC